MCSLIYTLYCVVFETDKYNNKYFNYTNISPLVYERSLKNLHG